MNFDIPLEIQQFLDEVDRFIEREIKPLEAADDNIRFFDHRREDARTDWERQGLPNEDWEALLAEAKRRAIAAGIFSYPFPSEHGGRDGGNLGMAIIREHLAKTLAVERRVNVVLIPQRPLFLRLIAPNMDDIKGFFEWPETFGEACGKLALLGGVAGAYFAYAKSKENKKDK